MSYYRYINFEYFYRLIKTNELKMTKPKLWDDKHENALGVIFEDDEKFLELYKRYKQLKDVKQTNEDMMRLYNFYNTAHACCFTENNDNEAMWRSFSYNSNAIQIEVNLDEYNNMGRKELKDDYFVKLVKVNYTDKISDIKDFISNLSRPRLESFAYSEVLATKRKAFAHENEYRLLIGKGLPVILKDNENPLESIKQLSKTYDFKETKDIEYIPFDKSYICSVTVHPFATEDFLWCVENLCNEENLCFNGKSKIYNF